MQQVEDKLRNKYGARLQWNRENPTLHIRPPMLLPGNQCQIDNRFDWSRLQDDQQVHRITSGGLSAAAKQEQKEGCLKLGGPGKVVEVDEMPICRSKHGVPF